VGREEGIVTVLTIDTATPTETVGLVRGGRLLAQRVTHAGRGHADELAASVDDVLKRSSVSLSDLDGIAVSIGPGRFTGLRVGLSTAKGLSVASGVPVMPVPTLEALAASVLPEDAPPGTCVCAMLDARRGEVYAAAFLAGARPVRLRPDAAVGPAAGALAAVEAAGGGSVVFAGTGAVLYRDDIVGAVGGAARFPADPVETPEPSAMALVAESVAEAGPVDAASLMPIYLRGL
jgi:tRNA threonylcarbamoyladenosine biosynthesis protein TsaB